MSYKQHAPIPVNEGGTGDLTLTLHGVLIGETTSSITTTAAGTTGQVLTGVTGSEPVWASPAASSISLTGDSGGALTGSSFTIYANTAANNAGSSVSISGSGTTLTLNLTDSLNNTLLGKTVGNATISGGNNNTAVGYTTLNALTSGDANAAFGDGALSALTSGQRNTAIGDESLAGIQTGSFNTAIGGSAGSSYNLANSSNISIGYGTSGTIGESNVLRIGSATGTSDGQVNKAFICGIDGVNVGSVAKVLTMASDQVGTATITPGTGISVTPGANTITIANTAVAGTTWSVITANQTAAVNNGYFCNKAGTLALALPASSAVGDVIEVCNINTATGVQFTQAAGQQIFISTASTTSGATGTLTSSAIGDSMKLVCSVANLTWRAVSIVGNWSPA